MVGHNTAQLDDDIYLANRLEEVLWVVWGK